NLSDVVVFKGTEPLLPDIERYLDWMKAAPFGNSVRPLIEHFPLAEGKAPGTLTLAEAMREAVVALDLQRAHLEHYRELARVPTPLAVYQLPDEPKTRLLEQLGARLSRGAFDRVEPYLQKGVGVLVSYYHGPPARVVSRGREEPVLSVAHIGALDNVINC